tara:strand:+ start:6676 stop:7224 length:549 start_codon:yes stop_codon:yes gene_type:complete
MSKKNKDWITLTFPVKPLQITFERELFEDDHEKDFTEEHCLESAWDIIGDMGRKEMGEFVFDQFTGAPFPDDHTDHYKPKVTSGYNDEIEGDIKEIMDSKTKSAEIISLGDPPEVECENPVSIVRETVWTVKPTLDVPEVDDPDFDNHKLVKKKNKQIGNTLELDDGTVLVLNDNLQWEKQV